MRSKGDYMKRMKGSLTVETALILPIYMFLTIALVSIAEMMTTYAHMEFAVHETAREAACFSYLRKDIPSGGLLETETVIRAMLCENYGYGRLNNSIIEGKALGIHMFRSEIPDDDGAVDLIVTYKVSPLLNVFDIGTMNFCNRARIHAWNGYAPSEEDENGEYVYITENGNVYHTNPDCTYLHVSVITVSADLIDDLRNADGKKYDKCKMCFDEEVFDAGGPLFVTERGEAIHTSLSCSGLKRKVYKVRLSEVGDRSECSRCRNYKTGRKKTDDGNIDSDSLFFIDGGNVGD